MGHVDGGRTRRRSTRKRSDVVVEEAVGEELHGPAPQAPKTVQRPDDDGVSEARARRGFRGADGDGASAPHCPILRGFPNDLPLSNRASGGGRPATG